MINDEKLFKKVEGIINTSIKRLRLKKYTKEEVTARAKTSETDIENGEIFSNDQVEKISNKW